MIGGTKRISSGRKNCRAVLRKDRVCGGPSARPRDQGPEQRDAATNLWRPRMPRHREEVRIDLKTTLEVVNAASGRSNVTENLLPSEFSMGSGHWSSALADDKDVRIAEQMAHRRAHRGPVSRAHFAPLHRRAKPKWGRRRTTWKSRSMRARMNGSSGRRRGSRRRTFAASGPLQAEACRTRDARTRDASTASG